MEEKTEYIYNFSGKVLPERVNFSLNKQQLDAEVLNMGYKLRFVTSISNSQILFQIKSTQKINDFPTLRNIVADFLRIYTDSYGYIHGFAYDIEITSMTTNYDDSHIVFGVQINEIESELENRPVKELQDIVPLLFGEEFYQLRFALGDLRMAIKNPKDTGVFCYRALESLMQYFNDKDDRKQAWEELNKNLNLDMNSVKIVRENAWSSRHGKPMPLGDKLRTEIMKKTWVVVDRYIVFAKNGTKPLDPNQYPILK